jgi:hypothetical protein
LVSRAYWRQLSCTGQVMQMATAASIWSIAGPVVPTGKNRVGSESRQAARSRQSVVMVVVSKMFLGL